MRTLTRKEISILVALFGGDEAVRMILSKVHTPDGFVLLKYPWLTGDQIEAILNIAVKEVGEERLPDILAGRLSAKWKEVIRLLVDKNSRCIPDGLESRVVDSGRQFHLEQPALDTMGIVARLAQLKEFWPFPGAAFPSSDEIEARYQVILKWLNLPENNENGVSNLLNAPHLLGILPQISPGDYGTILETLVEAVAKSYQSQFPGRRFTNHMEGKLAGRVSIAEGVRYHQLIKAITQGPVVYVSFRTCLQGFSIPADREQEARMPDSFILSGGLDTAADIIVYPDILLRDFETPKLDCAANSWTPPPESDGESLNFGAWPKNAQLSNTSYDCGEADSGGFLVLG